MKYTASNWNNPDDNFTEMFYEQNMKQFWLPSEFLPSKDVKVWIRLKPEERDTYRKVLAGLTLLDTQQGDVGMPQIAEHVKSHQRKAVLNFMAMMENAIHAKSYSTIFTTLDTKEDIDEVFEWVEENKYLQRKTTIIDKYYRNIEDDESLYMAMVASVFLESFLFYSGFFYPLYLAGQGKMIASGEVINLIIRDENIHGVYVSLLAQELYNSFLEDKQQELNKKVYTLLEELMENEVGYTEELYSDIGLDNDVKAFIRYNANKALQNLGLDTHYEDEEINPIVLNGLSTETKTYDFFSNKGNGYQKGKVGQITDDTFAFVNKKIEKTKGIGK